ncbi:hypothetical protein [Candidatus Lokiarchaeum ossiferum]|uniref:hypothetical protein n=1 Tax=Candidatus Lokiarchaeum ossiferum TaxID=2951803 RepID=UPI00352BE9D5
MTDDDGSFDTFKGICVLLVIGSLIILCITNPIMISVFGSIGVIIGIIIKIRNSQSDWKVKKKPAPFKERKNPLLNRKLKTIQSKNPEELIQYGKKTHEKVVKSIDLKQFPKSIELLRMELSIYGHLISQLRTFGLEIPQKITEQKRESIQGLLYKVEHSFFLDQYDIMSRKFRQAKQTHQTRKAKKYLQKLSSLVESRRWKAQYTKHQKHLEEYLGLQKDIENHQKFAAYSKSYAQFEKKYNSTVKAVNSGQYQKSMKRLLKIKPDFDLFWGKLQAYCKGDFFSSLVSKARILKQNWAKMEQTISDQYSTLLTQDGKELLSLDELTAKVTAPVFTYSHQEDDFSAYLHELDQQFLQWDESIKTSNSKV